MPAPDFGRQLSHDRFKRVLRYLARGIPEREKLKQNPWAEVDPWVKGCNAARKREIKVGFCITPDEMMFEWKGKSGLGGYLTCLSSNANLNLWELKRRVRVKGLWEFVFISKFRRESWLCQGRNFAKSIRSQRPVLSACVMPYL